MIFLINGIGRTQSIQQPDFYLNTGYLKNTAAAFRQDDCSYPWTVSPNRPYRVPFYVWITEASEKVRGLGRKNLAETYLHPFKERRVFDDSPHEGCFLLPSLCILMLDPYRSTKINTHALNQNMGVSLAPQVGLEPTTLRLTAECSAIELLRNI